MNEDDGINVMKDQYMASSRAMPPPECEVTGCSKPITNVVKAVESAYGGTRYLKGGLEFRYGICEDHFIALAEGRNIVFDVG